MTTLGKILVVTTAALSLAFLGFALGIYTNRIDWPGGAKTPSGSLTTGLLSEAGEQVKQWQKQAEDARNAWSAATEALVRLEKRQPAVEKGYAEQINLAETAPAPQVVNVFDRKDSRLDADGRPVMVASEPPLLSRRSYYEELSRMNQEIQRGSAEVSRLIGRERELTLRLTGDPNGPRGLRVLAREEKVAQQNALDEEERLRPLRINLQVEARLLEIRQRALEARADELRRVGIAAGALPSLLDSPAASRHTPRP